MSFWGRENGSYTCSWWQNKRPRGKIKRTGNRVELDEWVGEKKMEVKGKQAWCLTDAPVQEKKGWFGCVCEGSHLKHAFGLKKWVEKRAFRQSCNPLLLVGLSEAVWASCKKKNKKKNVFVLEDNYSRSRAISEVSVLACLAPVHIEIRTL